MDSVYTLDSKYSKLKKINELLDETYKSINNICENNAVSKDVKVEMICQEFEDKNIRSNSNTMVNLCLIADVVFNYKKCLDRIKKYEEALTQYSVNGNIVISNRLNYEKDNLIIEYKEFDYSNKKLDKNAYSIDSYEKMIECISESIKKDKKNVNDYIERIKNEAKSLFKNSDNITMDVKDAYIDVDSLPVKFLVGRRSDSKTSHVLFKDLGYSTNYEDVFLNIKDNGNIIIRTSIDGIDDSNIDEFVIAYIFKFIEAFPSGKVNIHFFDRNTKYIFSKLESIFKGSQNDDNTKRTISMHSSLVELDSLKTMSQDIANKFSIESPDLFSVYERDRSDKFNLVILRDGLVQKGGYGNYDSLGLIDLLSEPNETGHRSGIRFLIIDNSMELLKGDNDTLDSKLVNKVYDNCELIVDYDDGIFKHNEYYMNLISINNHDLEYYVQNRAAKMISRLSSIEKNYVLIEDVVEKATGNANDNILYIPIGKSGEKVINIPLSCRDEDGSVDGQCIGYMVIGQSGSGKSSLFHSLVLNGCYKYSPSHLQFWLLDFKFGGASSKYLESELPHIRIVSENNKIDDALCLFQMIQEEMFNRNELFKKYNTDNIIDYNRIVMEKGSGTILPRIIIAIDEVQEIFRDDNVTTIKELISKISTRMRSAGMHFIMIAQNLSEGKAYMLKESFMPSASGRICFRVASNIPRDSGFEKEFSDRKEEISELQTGEAYISYGKDTITKIRIAYASSEDMYDKYFVEIKSIYENYLDKRPLIIGSKKRLRIIDMIQQSQRRYLSTFRVLRNDNDCFKAILGEDSYRLTVSEMIFTNNQNSSLLLLGDDRLIASSLCTSIALSLVKQKVKVHLFNGDKMKIQGFDGSVDHPFMYLCRNDSLLDDNISNYKLSEFDDVLKTIYKEYLKRRKMVQESEDDIPVFEPVFLIVNDLFGIEDFVNNITLEENDDSSEQKSTGNLYPIPGLSLSKNNSASSFRENIQNVVNTLLSTGSRYSIYIILSIKGSASTWRNGGIISEVNNVILFNKTNFADQLNNSYYIKEMLKNIRSETEIETLAIRIDKNKFSKLRPIIYDMTDEEEFKALKTLIGESYEKII